MGHIAFHPDSIPGNILTAAQQDLSNLKAANGATITRTETPGPLPGTTAWRIQTAGGSSATKCELVCATPAAGTLWSEQVWVRNRGAEPIGINPNVSNVNTWVFPGGWQLAQLENIAGDGVLSLEMRFRTGLAEHNLDLDLYSPVIISGATLPSWRPSRNPARPQITPTPAQATARTAGGVAYGYDPALIEELIPLTWSGLSAADLASLREFFTVTVQGMVTPFTLFDPWADAVYQVGFATPDLAVTETAHERYTVSLTLSRVL